jgi:hypothetical protein
VDQFVEMLTQRLRKPLDDLQVLWMDYLLEFDGG